jgi:hypothetical protein
MALSMKGASRLSLVTARTNLDKIVSGLDSPALDTLSADLFFMVRVLDSSIALRRAATDNSRDEASKVALGNQLFNSSTGKEAKALYSEMTSLRWSSPRDLGDVLEVLSIEVQSISAEKGGDNERLESEIFNFVQIVAANPQLRATFAERVTGPMAAPKSQIVKALLTGKATQSTISLISTDLLKFGEFVNTLPIPSCMCIMRFNELRGPALIVFESKLANHYHAYALS